MTVEFLTRRRMRFPRKRQYGRRGRLVDLSDVEKDYEEWRSILSGDPCSYCGARGVPMEIDHMDPLSAGGSFGWDNLTQACRRCNQRKMASPLTVYLVRRNGLRLSAGLSAGRDADCPALAGARHARGEQSREEQRTPSSLRTETLPRARERARTARGEG